MSLDHDAIYKVYSDCVRIDDSVGAFKADGTQITLVQSDLDAARVTLDAEASAKAYQRKRRLEYPSIQDQLDDIYHNGIDAWKATIKATKDKYPKP